MKSLLANWAVITTEFTKISRHLRVNEILAIDNCSLLITRGEIIGDHEIVDLVPV